MFVLIYIFKAEIYTFIIHSIVTTSPLLSYYRNLYSIFCGCSCKKSNKKSVNVHDQNLGEETV